MILCTFNRADRLARAIDALVAQRPGTPPFEVLVVDNNSTDDTRAVVRSFASAGFVHYLFEPEQGLSAARNHGVRAARAPVVAFTDDDVRVHPDWVATVHGTLTQHPEVEFIGGKVLPIWQEAPPPWLQAVGLAPLALVDYGESPTLVTPDHPVCLVGANLAVRCRAFERVGLFSRRLQRVRNGIGSTEDQELESRLLASGCSGLYVPSLVVRTEVPRERLRRDYHRAWHSGHGRYYALMRDPHFERSTRTILGVPAHVYRATLAEVGGWLRDAVLLRDGAAFAHELRLRFLMNFARQRIVDRRHG